MLFQCDRNNIYIEYAYLFIRENDMKTKKEDIQRKTKDCILKNSGKTITKSEAAAWIGIDEDEVDEVLSRFGNVKRNRNKYEIHSMCFCEYIKSCTLTEDEKAILLERINGKTLQGVADRIGKTRETARLKEKEIVQKLKDNFSVNGAKKNIDDYYFIDELFEGVIKNAKFEKEFYQEIIKERPEFAGAMYFLRKVKPVNNDSAKTSVVYAAIKDKDILPEWFIQKVIEYYHPAIVEGGAAFPRYDGNVLTEILRVYGPLTTKELTDIYTSKKYIVDTGHEITGYGSWDPQTREGAKYFAYVYPMHKNVIRTGKHGSLRYYDEDKYDNIAKEVLKDIEYINESISEKIKEDGKLNAKWIFKANEAKLHNADINNEYELHSIMRSHEEILPDYIQIGRIPNLIVKT